MAFFESLDATQNAPSLFAGIRCCSLLIVGFAVVGGSLSFLLIRIFLTSAASLVSMKQISLKPGGKLIAPALTIKKRFLPVGF